MSGRANGAWDSQLALLSLAHALGKGPNFKTRKWHFIWTFFWNKRKLHKLRSFCSLQNANLRCSQVRSANSVQDTRPIHYWYGTIGHVCYASHINIALNSSLSYFYHSITQNRMVLVGTLWYVPGGTGLFHSFWTVQTGLTDIPNQTSVDYQYGMVQPVCRTLFASHDRVHWWLLLLNVR